MSKHNGIVEERGRALQAEFFTVSAVLHEELSQERVEWERRSELSVASGINDEGILRLLVDLEVSMDMLSAMTLVPLVEVAWADGSLHEKEHAAILQAAEQQGIAPATPAHELLDGWLAQKPGPGLMQAWESYIEAVFEPLLPEERTQLSEALIGRARAVAKAAGGFLGVGSISKEEEAVLGQLERALAKETRR